MTHQGQPDQNRDGFCYGAGTDHPQRDQPSDSPDGKTTYIGSVMRRTVSVKGSGGVTATVAVIVQQGQVWVSIVPPFTWEAIMVPEKADELIHTLELARDDAKKMTTRMRRLDPG